MHPGQHLTVLNVMSYSKQVGKATIENGGLPTKTTEGRKHQRCKRPKVLFRLVVREYEYSHDRINQ